MIRAAIFDFNGVIIDDEHLHLRGFQVVLEPLGVELTRDDYYARYLGFDDKGCFAAVLEQLRGSRATKAEIDRLIEEKTKVYMRELRRGIRVFPGAEKLIRRLAEQLPLAINSGARRQEIEYVLEHVKLSNCFAAIVSADEVKVGKPDPEGYTKAFELLRDRSIPQLKPNECVVIEDSPQGIAAAHAAGMPCIAVTHTYPRDQLTAAGIIVDSLGKAVADELLSVRSVE